MNVAKWIIQADTADGRYITISGFDDGSVHVSTFGDVRLDRQQAIYIYQQLKIHLMTIGSLAEPKCYQMVQNDQEKEKS